MALTTIGIVVDHHITRLEALQPSSSIVHFMAYWHEPSMVGRTGLTDEIALRLKIMQEKLPSQTLRESSNASYICREMSRR